MRFLVLGNSAVYEDGLAVRLIPKLQTHFPQHEFVPFDPNEQIASEEVWAIDVVKGIEKVCILDENDVHRLKSPPTATLHDFDFAFQLKLMINLGIVKKVHIIAIPYGMEEMDAEREVCGAIADIGK